MTTIEQLTSSIENESLRNTIVRVYKNSVLQIISKGFDSDQANRLAFDFLFKDGGFNYVIKKSI